MDRVSVGDAPPVEVADDVFLSLPVGGEEVSVQHSRIELSAAVPVHGHLHEQVGCIVIGELTFLTSDNHEELVVGPGDSYPLVGDEPHGAENRDDEIVIGIGVFSPPWTNPPWLS